MTCQISIARPDFITCQAVFLAYMVVLKKKGNVGVAAVLIIFTATAKIL
jgi:hypothetical protein